MSGGPSAGLLDKARAVAARVRELERELAGAQQLAHQAEIREALARTELTIALHGSLSQHERLQARHRRAATAAYRRARSGRLRRNNRINQLVDRILLRLGKSGRAALIDRSGGQAALQGLFDPAWYLAAYPDVARRRVDPLAHYLTSGAREGRSPGPLFDEAWYRQQNAVEIAATSLSGLEHYLRKGAADGQEPHLLFDTGHYLAQEPDLGPDEDAAAHYLREGGRLGLSPHPLFDTAWYLEQAPESAGTPGLVHYLATGWRRGLSPHPLFDPAWYVDRWPEVAETGLSPLVHFVAQGGAEGRSPGPWFDLEAYAEQRGALLPAGKNPLIDYLQGGAWTCADVRPGFPTAAYIAARPDLVRAGVTPLEHWARTAGR